MNFFRKVFDFIKNPSHSRTAAMLAVLVIVAAIPLSVCPTQQQQTLKQRAASAECSPPYPTTKCVANENNPSGATCDATQTCTENGIPGRMCDIPGKMGDSCNGGAGVCDTYGDCIPKTPGGGNTCNTEIDCTEATCRAREQNTCGPTSGLQDCRYIKFNDGSKIITGCTPAPAINQPCYADNCSAGYTCSANSICVSSTNSSPTLISPRGNASFSWPVTLRWESALSQVTSYDVYITNEATGAEVWRQCAITINALQLDPANPLPEGAYSWRVGAYSDNDCTQPDLVGEYSAPATFTIANSPPITPNCNDGKVCNGPCLPNASSASGSCSTTGTKTCVFTTIDGAGGCNQVATADASCSTADTCTSSTKSCDASGQCVPKVATACKPDGTDAATVCTPIPACQKAGNPACSANGTCNYVADSAKENTNCTINNQSGKCDNNGTCVVSGGGGGGGGGGGAGAGTGNITLVLALNDQDVPASTSSTDLSADLVLYNLTTNLQVAEGTKKAQSFARTSIPGKKYSANIAFTSLPQDKYFVIVRKDKMIAKSNFVVSSTTGTVSQTTTLVFGDINNDNDINISDYNAFRDCWRKSIDSNPSCATSNFDNNKDVEQVDYNTWVRGLKTWNAEGI